ncbi:hypothetical protein BH24ACT4_BH24ACT4_15050 [soil metagenome]
MVTADPAGRERLAISARGSLVGLATVLVALSAADGVYGPGWAGPVVGAAVAAAAVNVVVRVALASGTGPVLVIAHAVGSLLWSAVAVRPAVDGATSLGGLTDASARLLSTLPPVDARGPELALAVMVTWGAVAAASTLASRRGAGLISGLPAVLIFVLALLVGDPRRVPPDRWSALLAAVIGLVLLLTALERSSQGAGRRNRWRAVDARRRLRLVARGVSGTTVVIVAVAVAVVAVPSVPGLDRRERVDLRDQRDLPVDVRLTESPLDAIPRARRAEDPPVRFRATVELPKGHDSRLAWRIALLDSLGPGGWSQSPTAYVRAGSVLGAPPDDQADARARAQVDLELGEAFAGVPTLPTLDRPTSISPSGLAFDRRDGMLAVPVGTDRPQRMSMDVALPVLTEADLLCATAPREEPGDDVPASLLLRAAQITGGTRQPLRVLSLITDALARDRSLTLDPTTTGLTRTALVASALEAGASGETEVINEAQLAAAFALLARADGLVVRLAVGYLTPVTGPTETLAVTDEALTVWPEVRFDGLGWVPFPPRPPAGDGESSTAPPEGGSQGVVDGAIDSQTDAAARAAERSSGGPVPSPPAPPVADGPAGEPPGLLIVAVVIGAAIVALLAVGPLERGRRRRRRRRGGPRTRIVGAWDDVMDSLARSGTTVSTDRTRPEVLDLARARLGSTGPTPDGLAWLANRTDGVVFGAEDGEAAEGDRAWQVAGATRAATRRPQRRRDRLLVLFLPPPRHRPAGARPDPASPDRPRRRPRFRPSA